MMSKLKGLKKLPVKAIEHLFADKYCPAHKMFAGAIFTVAGIAISIVVGEYIHTAKIIADGIGSILQGAGCTPFIEHAAAVIKAKQKVD